MSGQVGSIGTRLPALGSRGEGWVVLQVVLVVASVASGLAGPAWSGDLRAAGIAAGIGLTRWASG